MRPPSPGALKSGQGCRRGLWDRRPQQRWMETLRAELNGCGSEALCRSEMPCAFLDTFQRSEPVLWMFPKVSGNQSSKVYTLKQEALHLDAMI